MKEEIWKFIEELQPGNKIEFRRDENGEWTVISSDSNFVLAGKGISLEEAFFNV